MKVTKFLHYFVNRMTSFSHNKVSFHYKLKTISWGKYPLRKKEAHYW